jgi:hypothetical protein
MMECRKCGLEKPTSEFECISPTKGWYRKECSRCVYLRHKAQDDASKQAIRDYNRTYYRDNKEKLDKRSQDWIAENPEKRRKTALSYYYRLQHAAILAYGGYRCTWCGIDEPFVLAIDHVNNDGKEHRKLVGSVGGHKFYKWLRDHEYPKGFQVLCMNCNHAKYRNGGTIPDTLKGRCNDYPRRGSRAKRPEAPSPLRKKR